MRATELWTANAAALATGLILHRIFRPAQTIPVVGLLLVGLVVVRTFRSRRPVAGNQPGGLVMRLFELILNGIYGGFFALLAYFALLAFTGQIGYPYR